MKRILSALFIVLNCVAGIYSASAQTITNLEIRSVEGLNVIILPPGSAGLVLQSATDLTASNWTAVTDGLAVTALAVSNTGPQRFFRLYNPASSASYGMIQIAAGSFQMGDSVDGNPQSDAYLVTNYISAYYIDTNLVSYSQWQPVFAYATNLGYTFDDAGSAKATNHPVVNLNWYDCVKWCNARSQKNGLVPCYYTDAGFTQVYTNGDTDAVYVNYAASGYRLPTEAEWEKASRGGVTGARFPFGYSINETLANYYGLTGSGGYPYDAGPTGYNAAYANGSTPYTSPVGSFAANGYGVYDMCGNVLEWCGDWYYQYYTAGTDPTGPSTGSDRVFRGGSWANDASGARCARRWHSQANSSGNNFGFRCVTRL